MTKTPEEIAESIFPWIWSDRKGAVMFATSLISTAIREAEARGRKASSVDANECGLWCPNCGAHLRAPEGEAKP